MIDRNLCVGMMIVGTLGHYDATEIMKWKSLQYIAATLRKKNFSIKNGSSEDRVWADADYVRKQMHSQPKKAQKIQERGIKAVTRATERYNRWVTHSKIADDAWVRAANSFPATNAITTSALILALINKSPELKKFYGFNQKKLDKFRNSSEFKDLHFIASGRVASKLLEFLDEEISHYNFNKLSKESA